ncbi:MAG: DUF5680 domain-containing protein [Ferrimicrobium sp.]
MYDNIQPLWSMEHLGGMAGPVDHAHVQEIYAFLQGATREVARRHQYRDPNELMDEKFLCVGANIGDLARFHGMRKTVRHGGRTTLWVIPSDS